MLACNTGFRVLAVVRHLPAITLMLLVVSATPITAFARGTPEDCDPCVVDEDCEAGKICEDLHCVDAECLGDADCLAGEICEDGRCVPEECANDADCPDGEICEDGRCVAEECANDADCPDGEICEDGRCVAEECANDADCPDGEVCEDGRCEEEGLCGELLDCSELDTFCGLGFCNAETQSCEIEPQNDGVECAVNSDLCVVADVCADGECLPVPVCVPGCELCDGGECSSLCGNPLDPENSEITASDALFTLRVAVDLDVCALCICDLTGDGVVSASDALAELHAAVKLPIVLACPLPGGTTSTTSTTSTTTTTFDTSTTTSTTLLGV